jgi:hypothetical protein
LQSRGNPGSPRRTQDAGEKLGFLEAGIRG